MSLPRSIDYSDLAGSTITLNTNAETVVLVGPRLQTPKDTSFIVIMGVLNITLGAAAASFNLRVRMGNTVGGAVVGPVLGNSGVTAGQVIQSPFMVSLAANFTDYVQVCVTVQQGSATGNGSVNAGTMLTVSF